MPNGQDTCDYCGELVSNCTCNGDHTLNEGFSFAKPKQETYEKVCQFCGSFIHIYATYCRFCDNVINY